ncbi:MAG: prepilin-type N-terminal cleavage/methylation domain-containing protein [Bacilli bacterium]
MKNKNNKKGFTLIELLAIIVILAIIAVITVPIILNIIENAQKGAAKDSAYGLVDTAKLYYYKFDGTSLGNYACDFKSGCNEIKYEGEDPTSGTLRINEKGMTSGEVTYKNKYTFCIYDNKIYNGTCEDTISDTLADEVKEKGKTHIYDSNGNIDSNKLAPCIKFDITVKTGEDPIPFCVIGETENEVTLISKNNIGTETQWGGTSSNEPGPNKSLTSLLNETKDWNNVPVITTYTYDDSQNGTKTYGYDNLTISNGIATITRKDETTETIGDSSNKMRARLITYEEIRDIAKGKPFDWMADIWTLSSVENDSSNAYRIISANASNPTMIIGYAVYDTSGLKPVIQISKDNL